MLKCASVCTYEINSPEIALFLRVYYTIRHFAGKKAVQLEYNYLILNTIVILVQKFRENGLFVELFGDFNKSLTILLLSHVLNEGKKKVNIYVA